MRFLQEAGKKATGKGKAVGGRNHTEALETKKADEKAQDGCTWSTDTDGTEHSMRELKANAGTPWTQLAAGPLGICPALPS